MKRFQTDVAFERMNTIVHVLLAFAVIASVAALIQSMAGVNRSSDRIASALFRPRTSEGTMLATHGRTNHTNSKYPSVVPISLPSGSLRNARSIPDELPASATGSKPVGG